MRTGKCVECRLVYCWSTTAPNSPSFANAYCVHCRKPLRRLSAARALGGVDSLCYADTRAIPYAPSASAEKAPRRERGELRLDVWLDAPHAALLTALAAKHGGNATGTIKEALQSLFVSRPRTREEYDAHRPVLLGRAGEVCQASWGAHRCARKHGHEGRHSTDAGLDAPTTIREGVEAAGGINAFYGKMRRGPECSGCSLAAPCAACKTLANYTQNESQKPPKP